MIDVYYTALHKILMRPKSLHAKRLTLDERQQIQNLRYQFLSTIFPDLIIRLNAFGKPIANTDLYFNQSHSHRYYALAYSRQIQDIGVDIEDLHRPVRMHALAQEVFHSDEYHLWEQLSFNREYWFKVWTIKEAVLKAHGMGIRLDLKTLNTQVHATWDFGFVEHPLLGRFTYHVYTLPELVMSVAYRAKDINLVPIHLREF